MRVDIDIELRPLAPEHAQEIFDVLNLEREYMRVWLPFVDKTREIRDTRDAINGMMSGDNSQFCIYYQDKFVGLIGFKDTDMGNLKTEIGYWLSQSAQKKGIMTKSVKKLIEYAFSEMDMNRVQIKAAIGNDASRNIPERLGFVLEGIEREGELLVEDVYTDLAVYSLLKKEYNED